MSELTPAFIKFIQVDMLGAYPQEALEFLNFLEDPCAIVDPISPALTRALTKVVQDNVATTELKRIIEAYPDVERPRLPDWLMNALFFTIPEEHKLEWRRRFDLECTPPAPLILTFNDINNTGIVADPSNVAEWNGALIFSGTPYTSAVVVDNTVELYGGSGIDLSSIFLFSTELLAFDDQAGSIVTMQESAFAFAASLRSVTAPALTAVSDRCCNQCTSLSSFVAPLVTSIGQQAFVDCILNSVSFPICTIIHNNGFDSCDFLNTALFPLCTVVESGAFTNCLALSVIDFSSVVTIGDNGFLDTSLASIDFPTCITLGDGVFGNNTTLVSATLISCTSMGLGTFVSDTSLTTVVLPLCTNFGGTVGNNTVFLNIIGNTITATVPVLLQTCNAGAPDGDLVYLAANNTATINYV